MQTKVSILLPHFQTLELTLLCLRLLRRRTSFRDYETIVIDNGSQDGSHERLERVAWIRLVHRERGADERPARSHGLALNLGVQHSQAPLIVTLHTDTMVLRDDWLGLLVAALERSGPLCGAVGSWKMERQTRLQQVGKWLERAWQQLRGRSLSTARYIRTHCALYRREAIQTRDRMFEPSEGKSAGEELFCSVRQAGMTCQFLSPNELCQYVCHLNHATMALNRELGVNNRYMARTRARAIRRIQRFFEGIGAEEILADNTLDQ